METLRNWLLSEIGTLQLEIESACADTAKLIRQIKIESYQNVIRKIDEPPEPGLAPNFERDEELRDRAFYDEMDRREQQYREEHHNMPFSDSMEPKD
jgi:hypothetical protein